MKKSESSLPAAMEFETVCAEGEGAYHTTRLYAVEGRPGVYRRIKRTGTGLVSERADAVVALMNGSVLELVPFRELYAEFKEAGVTVLPPAAPGLAVAAPGADLGWVPQPALAAPPKPPPGAPPDTGEPGEPLPEEPPPEPRPEPRPMPPADADARLGEETLTAAELLRRAQGAADEELVPDARSKAPRRHAGARPARPV